MARKGRQLRRQELCNHQGDALRLGMNWTEEDLSKPQLLVESALGIGHPDTFHFEPLIADVSHGGSEAGGKPASRR
jgi:dihydroxy-acid dehydratase